MFPGLAAVNLLHDSIPVRAVRPEILAFVVSLTELGYNEGIVRNGRERD